MSIILYILAILAANVVTAAFAPIAFGPLLVPTGTLLIGLTFMLRDRVQHLYGRKTAYAMISIALVLSAITSHTLGDSMAIVLASAVAFALSETTDTEIYTRLHLPVSWRVFWSGSVGGVLDSAVFAVIGLSPIGAGFLPWSAIPMAIAGQAIVKVVMQALGALVVGRYANGAR